MRLILSSIAVAVIASSPASAEVVNPDKILCKRVETETGSNLRRNKKTCMKASEWKFLEQMNDKATWRLRDLSRGGAREAYKGGVGGLGSTQE